MADGFSQATADVLLAAAAADATHVQIHDGDPGSDGTGNVSAETTRQAISWGAAATSGNFRQIVNDTAILWASVSLGAEEDIVWVSLWDASSAGNFGGKGQATANPINNGDDLEIPIGGLVVRLNLAT